MINSEQFNRLVVAFPILGLANPQKAYEFQQATFFVSLPASKEIFLEGDHASALALIVSGSVRVYKIGKTGREITLYRFGAGDSCILTANAILSQQPFPANAIVEQPVEAVMIPMNIFRTWVQRYALWRDFVFALLSQRLTDVLALVDDLVFRRMDARTATLLLDRCQVQNPINVTHQEIAAELGSSREVVSRILEGFVSRGMIRSGRGMIEILDLDSISSLSNM
jgi:CRP/FNR family transcriptional regulator